MPWRENKGVANLDGFRRIFFSSYARCFGVAKNFLVATQEILEEIFFKMLLTQEIYPITWELKSLNKNPKQNALEFLAFGKDLLWIALRLDILTKIFRRILNKHLCSLCGLWMF